MPNGVKVSGHRIESEIILRDGDIIDIGETQILFADQELKDREFAMKRYKQ